MEKDSGKFDWPKEAVLQLINMWEAHECLYNPKHKFYHNKHARYSAFNAMAENLKSFSPDIGVNEVKYKLTYLRGQYTREVAKTKEKKSGSGTDDVYTPSAYYFSNLNFLSDFIKIRKGGCNLNQEEHSQADDSWDSSQQVDVDSSPAETSKRPRMSHNTPPSSRSISQEDSVLTAATTALQSIASNAIKNPVNEKDEAFSNYIKTELNEITNPIIKDQLMETITMAVFEAKKQQRMYDCNESNFSNFVIN